MIPSLFSFISREPQLLVCKIKELYYVQDAFQVEFLSQKYVSLEKKKA